MKRAVALIVCGLCVSALADQADDFDRDFAVLSQQNMFLRDRQGPRPRTERRPRTPSINYRDPAVQERVIVLRGVVIEGAELHAYVENTHSGELMRLSPGDPIARGRISDIAIDAIAYDYDGHQTWVEVGDNLAGGQSTEKPATQPAATTEPAADSRAGKPAPLPPGGGTLEERLKARRQQLQKK